MDSHSYKNVHDEIPICTKMYMTEKPFKKNMDSNLYINLHDENPFKKNMDSHPYRNVHDENLYEYG